MCAELNIIIVDHTALLNDLDLMTLFLSFISSLNKGEDNNLYHDNSLLNRLVEITTFINYNFIINSTHHLLS